MHFKLINMSVKRFQIGSEAKGKKTHTQNKYMVSHREGKYVRINVNQLQFIHRLIALYSTNSVVIYLWLLIIAVVPFFASPFFIVHSSLGIDWAQLKIVTIVGNL